MKRSPLRKFLIVMIIALIVSLGATNLVKRNKYVDSADKSFYGFFSMVRYSLFEYPTRTFSNFVEDYASFWDRRNDNDELRQHLVAASYLESRIKQLELEVESLKNLNELNSLYSDYELVSARIKTRSFDTWNQELTLDVGAQDGIKVDDGVVSSNGLVGRVVFVGDTYSIVSLLTSNDIVSKVSVSFMVGEVEVNGILESYNFKDNTYTIKVLNGAINTVLKTKVYTSGLGEIYPRGLFVGEISEVFNTSEGLSLKVTVESAVNFNALDYVKVVKNK